MKRIISAFLTIALIFCMFPVGVNANEVQFVTITIIHKNSNTGSVHKNLSVVEAGEDLLFSGEDLATLGGFEYRIEEGSAYFSRGMKTLRVDLSSSRLYPFEDIALVGRIDFAEKVQEIDGVYYFPGSEMLPWLNVTCLMVDGVLNIHRDDTSIWEIIPQFTPDEFAFDFTACCKELGVNGKYLKARAYLQDEGISGMFFDLIPVVGDYLDYYDLFEDALQDQSAAAEEMEGLLDSAEDADYWMGIADDVDVIEDLPDEIRVFGEAAKILANNAVSFAFELGTYVKHFYLHDENILTALFSMELNSNLYGLPDSATTALVEIRENYSDYYAGIENKMMLAIGETALDGLTDTAEGLYKAAVTLLGFAEATSPDWAEGINRISSYDVIADYCVSGYNEMTNQTWLSSVRDLRGLAYMYLYACEQNWTAMADYAAKEGNLDLKAKYEANANAAEDWQRTFMRATTSEQNDSHEYGDATGSMKQEYTDKLRDMFIAIPRYQSADEMLFDETCWMWSKGVTAGSAYAVLFHLDGTLSYYKMNEDLLGSTTYEYKNGTLTIDDIDYTWQDDQFVSVEKFEVNGSAEPEDFNLHPDDQERFYQFVPSFNVDHFVDEIQAEFGIASYTEFVSCIGAWFQEYPASIDGFITAVSVDLNADGKGEQLALISKDQSIYLQVYSESNRRYVLSCESYITSLDYCSQQNISLFFNNEADRYLLFVDKNTAGAYTGFNGYFASLFSVTPSCIELYGSINEMDYNTEKEEIPKILQEFGVPYAQNCAEINNITSQSRYTELLEVKHRYFNADPMGGWAGREHHLQLLTPEKRSEPVDAVQSWTITMKSYQGFTEYREETWTQEFESGKQYTILPTWEDGKETDYTVLSYSVDTQERTIVIFMDYPEGSEHWKGLVLDLKNNTYYGLDYTEL